MAQGVGMNRVLVVAETQRVNEYMFWGGGKRRTREIMESWLARWVLQLLQPKILSEFR